jgi:CubicO group peptidase (beta-lactamase class C family)
MIARHGQTVFAEQFGHRDKESGEPMTEDTIFRIYSMTKPIVSTALMMLFEEGRIRLIDPVVKFIPAFGDVKVMAGDGSLVDPIRPVMVRDLLTHTSGLTYDFMQDSPVSEQYRSARLINDATRSLESFVDELAQLPLTFQPGTRWSYGISVDVQAALVERISGQPFGQYVRQHVLDPLKMRETRYLVPTSDQRRLAVLYQRSPTGGSAAGVEWRRTPDSTYRAFNTQPWPLEPGAFGLTSTLDDYMRFARMLLNGGELDGVRILRPETVQLMATNHLPATVKDSSFLPDKGQVGFGIDFAVRVAPPKSTAENNGAVGEFFWDGLASTLFWVDPKNQLTAVLFTQMLPFDQVRLHKSFRDAVYGPITSPLQ